MKHHLTGKPILKLPDESEEFFVTIDDSKIGLGAVLTQFSDQNEHPIQYASRITTKYGKNFTSHELEGTAFILALKV